ncbi:tRNA (guanine-N(7)-)-methyltransferase non-catalytic subunit trm82 [Tulasnella sp. UAMH 9824]|nr:tRNA (guanine-N(7)-)-methyltransferase non-catalytic subunit trm82 [Tulasnella sp. UAMH 9824]
MPHLPFRRIFVGDSYAVAVAGNQLLVVSSSTGSLLASTVVCSAGLVTAADVSWPARRVVTTGDDKMLNVWILEEESETGLAVTQESSREIPKKSSEIHLTSDGQTILASDKFGDIYRYPVVPPPSEKVSDPSHTQGSSESPSSTKGKKKGRQQSSEEKPRHGELILGHTSVITSFTLTPQDEFVVSGDRDEHIRISWFPEGYNIERFCMGHLKYVSALHIPQSSPHTLVSGGGDPELFIWDWTNGTLLQKVSVMEKVKPLAKVKGGRRTFHRLPRRPDGEGLSRKSKRGKGKQKQPPEEEEADVGDVQEDAEDDGAEDGANSSKPDAGQSSAAASMQVQPGETKLLHKFDPTAESFVVGRIGSTTIGSEKLILFSAVGASGLFYFPIPEGSSSSGMEANPEVQLVDLGYPVLDFCAQANDPSSIWVSLDGTWEAEETGVSIPKMVKLVRWSEGRFAVSPESADSPPLLKGLNASVVTATESVASSLELYAQLAWLPKSREEEADDSGEAQQDEASIPAPSPGPSTPNAEGGKAPINKPPKKPAGRLKTREKLQRIQESGLGSAVPKPTAEPDAEEAEGEEILAKKAKVDAPTNDSA